MTESVHQVFLTSTESQGLKGFHFNVPTTIDKSNKLSLKKYYQISNNLNIRSTSASLDDQFLATADLNGVVIYDFKSGKQICTYELASASGTSVCPILVSFSRKTSSLLFIAHNKQVYTHNMKEVIVTRTFTEDLLSGFINCICVDGKDGFFVGSDKGEVVGFSSTSNVFQKYTVGDDTLTQTINSIETSKAHPNLLLVGGNDGALVMWDTNSSSPHPIYTRKQAHAGPISCVGFFNLKDDVYVSAGFDKVIRVWRMTDKRNHKLSMEINIGASVSYFALNDQDTFAIGTIVGDVLIHKFSWKHPIIVKKTGSHITYISSLTASVAPKTASSTPSAATIAPEVTSLQKPSKPLLDRMAADGNYMEMFSPIHKRSIKNSVTNVSRTSFLKNETKSSLLKKSKSSDSISKDTSSVDADGISKRLQLLMSESKLSKNGFEGLLRNAAAEEAPEPSKKEQQCKALGSLKKVEEIPDKENNATSPAISKHIDNIPPVSITPPLKTILDVEKVIPSQEDVKPVSSSREPTTSHTHKQTIYGGMVGHEQPSTTTQKQPQESANSTASEGSKFQYKLLENVMQEALSNFRSEIRNDVLNVHLEIVKQFYAQKMEIEELFEKYENVQGLLKEIERLRNENDRLRRNY